MNCEMIARTNSPAFPVQQVAEISGAESAAPAVACAAVGCAAACGAEAQQIAGVGGLHGAVELADAAVIAVRPAAEPIAQPGGREGRTIRCI
jgi:hypothetical protein